MKKFTDLFIRKPVLSMVVSLFILLLGLRALFGLQIQQFPKVENTLITVTTTYPGASADLMAGFVTSPLEKFIAGADGIDYMTSDSQTGTSTIKVYVKLNYDPETAFTNVMSKVAEVQNLLPAGAQSPIVDKDTAHGTALMYIAFNSDVMSSQQVTDYITRVVQPKIESVAGVSQAQILGGSTFAMRIWLNPEKMAAFNVTADDIVSALTQNNFQAAPGTTKTAYTAVALDANTGLKTPAEFGQIIIRQQGGNVVHLSDVATVKLGAQNYDFSVNFNGKKAVFIGVNATPEANPLTVITDVQKVFPEIIKGLPPGLHGEIVYDATKYIRSAIHEVIRTIIEAALIVIVVILIFLGSIRSAAIPMVTIPLSLVGVCFFMLCMNYSINLLTLLAMVLAIGMVVDDAIVVVENIYRHIEAGEKPFDAAILGAREIAMPIISMTITLAAVYAPIGFMQGITGALFTEFAFTLAGAVVISGAIALTLSPMMCSHFFSKEVLQSRMVKMADRVFDRLRQFYSRRLHSILDTPSIIVLLAVVVLSSCYFLYAGGQKELAPSEDQSVFFVFGNAPQYANINYTEAYSHELNQIFASEPDIIDYFVINGMAGPNTLISGAILKPWDQRKQSQNAILNKINPKVASIAGLQMIAFPLPSLPTGSDSDIPVSFPLVTTEDFPTLESYANKLVDKAQKSGLFIFVTNDLKFDNPEVTFEVDHAKAQQLGINMQSIANALAVGMGGNFINQFNLAGKSYYVIPELLREYRGNIDTISRINVRTASGTLIPLSTVVHFKKSVTPNALTHFQQLNSALIEGMPTPGHTLSEALNFLRTQADAMLPKTITYNFSGLSRDLMKEGNSLMITFIFSMIVIFLVLSAQFESFRDPLIILISVPMSICGALIPLNLGLATINIYTQIGLITLIGLISKHGILMVEFANKLQEQGLSIREAIEKAAAVRLRAIVMTTAAMIVGVVPLIMASGAGAVSRFDIGLVIASGMAIGTLFTLFVVPTMYLLIAKKIGTVSVEEK